VGRGPRLFAGWRVVAGAFLLVLAGFGAIYSYAAFADAIAEAFGADPVAVSMVYALSGGACFMVSAVSGPLADRLGPRIPAMAGMLMVSLGLMVAAAATSLAEIYAGYGLLIGLGTGFAYVPAMAAVQRWFTAYRGLASGIAVSGIGVGTALVPPAADAFQAVFDWRTTFVVFGVLVAVIGTAGALLLEPGGRRSPGREAVVPRNEDAPPPTLPPVVRTRAFALVWIGTLLVSVPAMLPHAMLVGTARELGLARSDALALLGLIGLGTIAGRFLIAAVADAIGRRRTFLACCGGMACSMAVWGLAEEEPALQAFALVFGALQGGFVALLPAFGADSFGARSVGGVLGALYTSRGFALLLAPPALAAAVAAAGHPVPIVAVGAIGLAGTLLLARTPRAPVVPPTTRRDEPDHVGKQAIPAQRQVVFALALLVLLLTAVPAHAQRDSAATLVWSAPAAAAGKETACARMLVLNRPRDWQAGDAAAVVAGPSGSGYDLARPIIAEFIAQQMAVLELPDARARGAGRCAEVPITPAGQLLGALVALQRELHAGLIVAIGVGPHGTVVFDALDEREAARLLGPQGPRFAGAAVLRGAGTIAFRAGRQPPRDGTWVDRAPQFCATLARFTGRAWFAACVTAISPGELPYKVARSP
jgi:MFS family permease